MKPVTRTKVSYSSHGFRDREFGAALDAISAAGFDCIELGSDQHGIDGPTAAWAKTVHEETQRRGMRIPTMHAPMGDRNPGTPVESLRKKNVASISEWIRFAGDVGIEGVVVHAVPNPGFLPEGDLAEQVVLMADAAERSMHELVDVAAATNVRILVENLPYKIDQQIEYPLITMTQLRRFVDPFPAESLGIVCDTGHAGTLRLDPVAEIEIAGDRLWGTHIQDVDGDNPTDNHWVPTHGALDWPAICGALRGIGYQGAWTFEVCRPRHGETLDELAKLTRAVADEWGL